MNVDYDVAVVGAGPIGLATAVLVARQVLHQARHGSCTHFTDLNGGGRYGKIAAWNCQDRGDGLIEAERVEQTHRDSRMSGQL